MTNLNRYSRASHLDAKLRQYKRDRLARLITIACVIACVGLLAIALAVTVTKGIGNTVAMSLSEPTCYVGGC